MFQSCQVLGRLFADSGVNVMITNLLSTRHVRKKFVHIDDDDNEEKEEFVENFFQFF